MGYDCGVWIGKYVLCIFNFLFFVLGTIVLGIGIWLAVDKASLIALLKMVENEHINQFTQPQVIEQLAYVLIAIGGVMFLMSFMGYCGAIRESKCLLTTYLRPFIAVVGRITPVQDIMIHVIPYGIYFVRLPVAGRFPILGIAHSFSGLRFRYYIKRHFWYSLSICLLYFDTPNTALCWLKVFSKPVNAGLTYDIP
uniref:Tetraspanin n=1 Tax=Glossina austeni TaxID=7395 RepID=A0A1A9V4K2_GLOAU